MLQSQNTFRRCPTPNWVVYAACAWLTVLVMAPALFSSADDARSESPDLTKFNFTRGQYDSTGGYGEAYYAYEGRVWERWETDFPQADENFGFRLAQLSSVVVNQTVNKRRLTAPDLGDFPLLYLADVGYMELKAPEEDALRDYLLRGGFLWVDDFWGEAEWLTFERAMTRVLPDTQWRTIPNDHPILHQVFDLDHAPQVPARSFASRFGSTSEPPWAHRYPAGDLSAVNFRGWFDAKGRLMVVATHNTDIGDGFEREAYGQWYFEQFSTKAYALGVNIVVYALTH